MNKTKSCILSISVLMGVAVCFQSVQANESTGTVYRSNNASLAIDDCEDVQGILWDLSTDQIKFSQTRSCDENALQVEAFISNKAPKIIESQLNYGPYCAAMSEEMNQLSFGKNISFQTHCDTSGNLILTVSTQK